MLWLSVAKRRFQMLKFHLLLVLLVWGMALLALYTDSSGAQAGVGILLFVSLAASMSGMYVTYWLINEYREQLVWAPETDRSKELLAQVVVGLLPGVVAVLVFRREFPPAHVIWGSLVVVNLGLMWRLADSRVCSYVLSDAPPGRSSIPLIRLQKVQAEKALDQLGPSWGFRRIRG